jgi:hypothetical protein
MPVHVMKSDRGIEVWFQSFFALAQDESEWSASYTICFTLREKTTDTLQTGGLVGPRTSVDVCLREKSAACPGNQTSDHLAHSLVTMVTELLWLLSSTFTLQ